MYRLALVSLLLLLSLSTLSPAQAQPKTEAPPSGAAAPAPTVTWTEEVGPGISNWQRFVLVFAVALLVIIVIQLMMLRADLTALLERLSGVSTGTR